MNVAELLVGSLYKYTNPYNNRQNVYFIVVKNDRKRQLYFVINVYADLKSFEIQQGVTYSFSFYSHLAMNSEFIAMCNNDD